MSRSILSNAKAKFLVLLAAPIVVILALIVPIEGSGEPQTTNPVANNDLLSQVVLPETTNLGAFYERPIFHASRQPFVAALPPAPAPVIAAPPAFALAGRLTSRAGVEYAYITDPGSGETLKLTLGDEIAGWAITEFQDDGILLTAGERTIRIGTDGGPGQAEGAAGTPARSRARTRRGNNQ